MNSLWGPPRGSPHGRVCHSPLKWCPLAWVQLARPLNLLLLSRCRHPPLRTIRRLSIRPKSCQATVSRTVRAQIFYPCRTIFIFNNTLSIIWKKRRSTDSTSSIQFNLFFFFILSLFLLFLFFYFLNPISSSFFFFFLRLLHLAWVER